MGVLLNPDGTPATVDFDPRKAAAQGVPAVDNRITAAQSGGTIAPWDGKTVTDPTTGQAAVMGVPMGRDIIPPAAPSAPAAAMGQPVSPMQPPAKPTMTTEGSSTTSSGLDKGSRKEIAAAAADDAKATAAEQSAMRAQAANDAQKAQAEQAAAQIAAEAAQRREENVARIQQEHQAEIKQRQVEADQAFNQWVSATPKDFYAGDDGAHRKVRAGLAIALGGLGAAFQSAGGMANPTNQGLAIVDNAIKEWDAKQREKIGKLKFGADFARGRVTDAKEAQDEALRALDLKTAAAYDRVAKDRAASLAKFGASDAQIAGDAMVAHASQQAAARKDKFAHDMATQVSTTTSRKMVEGGPAGAGAAGGRGEAALQKAGLTAQEVGNLAKRWGELSGVKVTPADLRKYQSNEQRMKLGEQGGTLGGLLNFTGLTPGSATEALPNDVAEKINLQRRIATVRASIEHGGAATPELIHLANETMVARKGDSPETIAKKEAENTSAINNLVGGLGMTVGQNARAGIDQPSTYRGENLPATPQLDDATAVRMARERIRRNPTDTVAWQVLRAHGASR